jgi:cyclic pyranopterin phosphate synthase
MLPQRKPHPPELRDGRGRRIRRLRVSLTDLCNLRCRYCMPAAGVNKMRHEDMLRLEELAWLVRVFVVDLGVPRVRVTGGEPLVRRGAVDFLRALGEIRGLRELALTTNACLLAEHARALRAAGVQRVNISLDTLDRERFRSITGSDELHRVLAGVEAAADAGFETVKLNAVVLPETLDEAPALVRFAAARGMVLRFIERMPGPGTAGPEPARHVPARRVMERLRAEFTVTPTDEGRHPGATAKLYHVEGPGLPPGALVGFITPISAPFCRSCDRVRLRGDGRLLPCLSQGAWIDLRPFVRPEPRAGALAEFVRAEMARAKDTLPGERRIEDMWRIGG